MLPISAARCCFFLFAVIVAVAGCTSKIKPFRSSKPETGWHTQVIDDLISLPPPAQKIVVTVYKFRDQTGQYRFQAGAVNYSTAITQGATSMLIKALEDAGNGSWFTVLERESLPNILNERKIIRQTRLQYMSQEELERVPPLPPLLYSPLLLDGGVISYETNLLTGGLGARYLGIGGNTEFSRDAVTIYLRLVSVKDGRILKSVETRKTIFSIRLDANVFKFVSYQNLLEAEAGYSSNEPPQMSVQEAIEQGVYALVMEGALDGIWNFADPERGKQLIAKYEEQKQVKPVPVYDEDGELSGFTTRTEAAQPAAAR
ncbi:curlin [Methylolobus aquaticus]|nr:curlin [Methylolobus aquaticus]